ncbi:MFS transporter [Quadrisphaera setariae]|uniref:MFS transporter n=1 Tax=Quadrisphaera setariae TaxID=2593304 RepID=UPI0021035D9A|nr:MFS transporter [Quadrisphaera setariae]
MGWAVAALGAALLVVAAQWQSVLALVVGLVLTGAGSASQLQARFAATDLAEPAGRGRALATVVWVGSLGSVLGPNLGAPGAWLADRLGLAPLGGAFVLAAAAMALGALAVWVLLRPDPLLVATGRLELSHRGPVAPSGPAPGPALPRRRFAAVRAAAPLLRDDRAVRTAFTAVITAQVVMVAIMTMTPVHLAAHGGSLTVVGLTISLHILGMYGLAPVAGALADRAGAVAGILTGGALFSASFVVAVLAADSTTAVVVSLVLLGLGWSFMGVAGSTWLGASVPVEQRAAVQGLTDTGSNTAAALGALLSGPLMAVVGFGGLSVAAAVCLVPLGVVLLCGRGAQQG